MTDPAYQMGLWDQPKSRKYGPVKDKAPRAGTSWNEIERNELIHGYLVEGLPISQLAKRHSRGALGISIELNRIMANKQKEERAMNAGTESRVVKINGKPPNAGIIRAYADGKTVQYLEDMIWVTYDGSVEDPALGHPNWKWRLELAVTIHRRRAELSHEGVNFYSGLPNDCNIEVTFMGNELVDVKVLK